MGMTSFAPEPVKPVKPSVWLLYDTSSYSAYELLGVYATAELAEAARVALLHEYRARDQRSRMTMVGAREMWCIYEEPLHAAPETAAATVTRS